MWCIVEYFATRLFPLPEKTILQPRHNFSGALKSGMKNVLFALVYWESTRLTTPEAVSPNPA
jgi:hypothetical protein